VLQYLLARGPARRAALRFGRRLGLTEDRLERVALRARRGGLLAISVAVLTPGVRSAVVPACGLAGIPLRTFVPGLVLGSAVDLALHFAVGYLGADVLTSLLAPAPLLIIAGLALVGLGAWLVLARRRRASAAEAFGGWAEATCPVCLALEAVVPHADEDVALGTSVL
jgi:membrane protein DedA with SNARE-associated domain